MEIVKKIFNLHSRFQQFLLRYFQDKALPSKLLPRSGIVFQVTSKIHTFLSRSCKTRRFLPRSCQTKHFLARSSDISARIMHAMSSKIVGVKSDKLLQKMYGRSTGVTKWIWFSQKIDDRARILFGKDLDILLTTARTFLFSFLRIS